MTEETAATVAKQVLVSNGTTALNVAVYNCQNVDAETVILLHGGPGVPEEFKFLVQALTPKFQVLNFEQRGLGQSTNPSGDYSIESYLEDINVIAVHFELDKFHLFGQSWGGLYAQIYAEEHPERLLSIFLSSPSSGTNSLWEQTEKEVLQYNRQHCTSGWRFLQMGWYSLLGALGMDSAVQNLFAIVFENYNRDYGTNAPVVTAKDLQTIKAAPVNATRPNIVQYKALSIMENPSFPIQITYGESDIYGPSREAVPKRYPTAQLTIIPKCGHLPWWHNPTEFAAILSNFYALE